MTTLSGRPLDGQTGIGALTLGGLLEEVADRFGGREALVFDDPLRGATVRWTYDELRENAYRVAGAIVAMGIGKGARVAILMGNRPEAVAAFFGVTMSGGVAVPLSTFSSRPELAFLLEHCDASVLLTQTELVGHRFVDDVVALRDLRAFPYLRRVVAVAATDDRSTDGAERWEDFVEVGAAVDRGVLHAVRTQVTPSDVAVITYSSGTTSRPKGMLHNHRAPSLQFWIQASVFRRHPETRLWTALPLFWSAGLCTAMGPTVAAGGCWVMQESFEPGEALALMAREQVTEPYCLPHQTAALEEHPAWSTTDLSSLRCVFGKSAFARHPSVDGDTTWNMPVAYGLSETCASFVSHRSDTPRELLKQSIGRVLPGNQLRVVHVDTGAPLGSGEEGELAVRGPTLMEHFVKQTRDECFDDDGFFHTGDVGFFDDDGFVHFTGRRTEMIKTGGANVSPAEIEVALRGCPPVKLARVIGVPDELLGQLVVLCVIPKDGVDTTEQQIKDFLGERVASYKVPKRVIFFAEGEIPMTTSDTKVRDAELLTLVQARLGDRGPSKHPPVSSTQGRTT